MGVYETRKIRDFGVNCSLVANKRYDGVRGKGDLCEHEAGERRIQTPAVRVVWPF